MDSGWMYRVYHKQAAASYLPLISLSRMFKNFKFSSNFSQELWGQKSLNLVHLLTMDGCIMYTRIRLLPLICLFITSFFLLSNNQTFTIFVTFFSGTVWPRKLKLVHMLTMGCMYCVYMKLGCCCLLVAFSVHFSFFSYKFVFLLWKHYSRAIVRLADSSSF